MSDPRLDVLFRCEELGKDLAQKHCLRRQLERKQTQHPRTIKSQAGPPRNGYCATACGQGRAVKAELGDVPAGSCNACGTAYIGLDAAAAPCGTCAAKIVDAGKAPVCGFLPSARGAPPQERIWEKGGVPEVAIGVGVVVRDVGLTPEDVAATAARVREATSRPKVSAPRARASRAEAKEPRFCADGCGLELTGNWNRTGYSSDCPNRKKDLYPDGVARTDASADTEPDNREDEIEGNAAETQEEEPDTSVDEPADAKLPALRTADPLAAALADRTRRTHAERLAADERMRALVGWRGQDAEEIAASSDAALLARRAAAPTRSFTPGTNQPIAKPGRVLSTDGARRTSYFEGDKRELQASPTGSSGATSAGAEERRTPPHVGPGKRAEAPATQAQRVTPTLALAAMAWVTRHGSPAFRDLLERYHATRLVDVPEARRDDFHGRADEGPTAGDAGPGEEHGTSPPVPRLPERRALQEDLHPARCGAQEGSRALRRDVAGKGPCSEEAPRGAEAEAGEGEGAAAPSRAAAARPPEGAAADGAGARREGPPDRPAHRGRAGAVDHAVPRRVARAEEGPRGGHREDREGDRGRGVRRRSAEAAMADFERQEAAQRRAVQDHVALVHLAVVDGLATIGRWREQRRLGEDAPEVSWWSKLGPLNRVERIVARELVSDRVTFECSAPGPKEWEARLSPFAGGVA